MEKEDVQKLIPIAFLKHPQIYKRVLESVLKDLNSDILFDKDKIKMLSAVIFGAMQNKNIEDYLSPDDLAICLEIVKLKIGKLTITKTNENLQDSLDSLNDLLFMMGLIGVKGFSGERKEKIMESLKFIKDHPLQKAWSVFSNSAIDPSFEFKSKYTELALSRIEETEFEEWQQRFDMMKDVGISLINIGKGLFGDTSNLTTGLAGLFSTGFQIFQLVSNSRYSWFDDVNKLRLLEMQPIEKIIKQFFMKKSVIVLQKHPSDITSLQGSNNGQFMSRIQNQKKTVISQQVQIFQNELPESNQLQPSEKSKRSKSINKQALKQQKIDKKYDMKLFCKFRNNSVTFSLINLLVNIITSNDRKLREKIKGIKLLWCIYNNQCYSETNSYREQLKKQKLLQNNLKINKNLQYYIKLKLAKIFIQSSDQANIKQFAYQYLLSLCRQEKEQISKYIDQKFFSEGSLDSPTKGTPGNQSTDFYRTVLKTKASQEYGLALIQQNSKYIYAKIKPVNFIEIKGISKKEQQYVYDIAEKLKDYNQLNSDKENGDKKDVRMKNAVLKVKKEFKDNPNIVSECDNFSNHSGNDEKYSIYYDKFFSFFTSELLKTKTSLVLEKTKQFVEQSAGYLDSKVMLIMGEPGTGKSILLRQIEDYYWSHKKKGIIPFYINLAEIDNLTNILNEYLKKQGLDEQSVCQLLMMGENSYANIVQRMKFLLIFDGYDEISKIINIYNENNLGIYHSVKIIISARKQFVMSFSNYNEIFAPKGLDKPFEEIEEVFIQNLDDDQINTFFGGVAKQNSLEIESLKQFQAETQKNQIRILENWTDATEYNIQVEKLHIQEIINTPFMITIVAQSLPDLVYEQSQKGNYNTKRVHVYEVFIEKYFMRESQKLVKRETNLPQKFDPKQSFYAYSTDLAINLYITNKTFVETETVNYVRQKCNLTEKKQDQWTQLFNNQNQKAQLAKKGAPIIEYNGTIRFQHKSLMEYFAAKVYYEEIFHFNSLSENQEILPFDLIIEGLYLNFKILVENESEILLFILELIEGEQIVKKNFAMTSALMQEDNLLKKKISEKKQLLLFGKSEENKQENSFNQSQQRIVQILSHGFYNLSKSKQVLPYIKIPRIMLNCMIIILIFPNLLKQWIECNLSGCLHLKDNLSSLSQKEKEKTEKYQMLLKAIIQEFFSILRKNSMGIFEILKAMSNETYKSDIFESLNYLYTFYNQFLTTKDLIQIAKQDYIEFFHKSEAPSDPKLEEKIEKLLEMECPIKKKSRKLTGKNDRPPKKIKDTHLLILVPDKFNLNQLKELILNELKISIRPHDSSLAEQYLKNKYSTSSHDHPYWVLVYKYQIYTQEDKDSGNEPRELQSQIIFDIKDSSPEYSNYQWIGIVEGIITIALTYRRSLSIQKVFSTTYEKQQVFRCSESNDFEAGQEIVFGNFNYYGEQDITIANPMGPCWIDNDRFTMMYVLQIGAWKNCLQCEENRKNEIKKRSLLNKEMKKNYFGDQANGMKSGYGCFYYQNNDKFVRYFGLWKNDLQEGEGFMEYTDGSEYYGNWANGKRNGFGKYFFKDKTEFYGLWENDIPVKDIEVKYLQGQIYKGQLKDFKKHGQGSLTEIDGTVISGKFENDQLNGQIKITYSNNSELNAKFINGVQEGKAITKYQSGNEMTCNYINNRIADGQMTFTDGSIFKGQWQDGYFKGNLNKNGNLIEGFLCGERFLKNTSGLYCQENEIRDMFENKKLFCGYKELAEILNCEIDAIPISSEIKNILQMPCPFTEGKKIYETHCLILYPTMLGLKQMNVWNFTNYYLKFDNKIPKNMKSSDSKNSIPMWFIIFNEDFNGKPKQTMDQPFDEAKNIVRTQYKNTEQYKVPCLLEALLWIHTKAEIEQELPTDSMELDHFFISYGLQYKELYEKNYSLYNGINVVRNMYLFEMIPPEVFVNEIQVVNNSFDSENNVNLNINSQLLILANAEIIFQIYQLISQDQAFQQVLSEILQQKIESFYKYKKESESIKEKDSKKEQTQMNIILSTQFQNLICLGMLLPSIWEMIFKNLLKNDMEEQIEVSISIVFREIFHFLRQDQMKILNILRNNEDNFEIVNSSLKIINDSIYQLYGPEDIIEQAKQEYVELFGSPPPLDLKIEDKIKQMLNCSCPLKDNISARIQDTHILFLLPSNLNMVELSKIMKNDINFTLYPFIKSKLQFFQSQNYWNNSHSHPYWALVHKHTVMKGSRKQQAKKLYTLKQMNQMYSNYEWVGFLEGVSSVYFSLRRSLNQNQTISTYTRHQEQYAYRCAEYNDNYSEEIIYGNFRYNTEKDALLYTNPSDWCDNDEFTVMQLFPIKDKNQQCKKCIELKQFEIVKEFLTNDQIKVQMNKDKKNELIMNSYGCYNYQKEESPENKGFDKYFGEFVNNQRHGQGTMKYTDDSYYSGNWVKNQRSGNGKYFTKEKEIIEGIWVNDKLQLNKCKMTKLNGEIYEGEIKENYEKNGYGKLITANKMVIIGQFKDNLPDGQVSIEYEDKTTETGIYQNNLKQGLWVIKSQAGVLELNFQDQIPQFGKFQFLNGDIFEGKWENGYGVGELLELVTGDKLEGYLCNNEFFKKDDYLQENQIKELFRDNSFFGYEEWNKFSKGTVKSCVIKKSILDILNSPCPFSSDSELTIKDTHIMLLLPSIINEQQQTLEMILNQFLTEDQVQNFKGCMGEIHQFSEIIQKSTWVLVYQGQGTNYGLIQNTLNKPYNQSLKAFEEIISKLPDNIKYEIVDTFVFCTLIFFLVYQEKKVNDIEFCLRVSEKLLIFPSNDEGQLCPMVCELQKRDEQDILNSLGKQLGIQAMIKISDS